MVSVPISEGNRVSVQAKGNDRFRYAAPRNLVGGAVEGFGRAIQGVASDIAQIEATYDDANKVELQNNLKKVAAETRLNVMNLKGRAAADALPDALKTIETRADELLKSARSPRARDMAKMAFDDDILNNQIALTSHANTEMYAFKGEQLGAQRDQFASDAVDMRGTEQFDVNLANGLATLEKLQVHNGWPDDKLKAEKQKFIQGVHSKEILAIDAEDGEPTRALARLDAVKKLIGPEAEYTLRNSLKPRVLTARFDEVVRTGGLDQYIPQPVAGEPAAAGTSAVQLLRDFEGFREGTYWDVNHHRTGYGSDTITTASGQVRKVQKGDRVTKADAERDLSRRVNDLTQTAAAKSGPGWDQLPEGAKAAIVSVAYNYGDASPRLAPLWAAAGEGNADKVASLIESFAGDNNGINRGRRQKEAEAARNGVATNPDDPRLNSAAMRDAARAYAKDNNLSEEETQALYAAADRTVSQTRQDRSQAEDAADRRLQDWLNNNKADPNSLTSIGEIPASIISGASANTIAQINSRIQQTQDRIQAKNDAAAAARAEADERNAIFELYTLSDAQLAAVDMRKYAGRVGVDKLGPWIDRQQSAANGNAGKNVSTDRIAGKIDTIGKAYGARRNPDDKGNPPTAEEKQAWTALRGYVERRVAGRPDNTVSDEELRGIIVAGMTEVEVKGTGFIWNDKMPRAMVPGGSQFESVIPVATKRTIEANLRSRLRRNPTEAEVFDAYQAGKARGAW